MLLSVVLLIRHLHWLVPAVVMFGSGPCFLILWWPTRIATALLPRRFYRRADDFLFSTYLRLMLFFFENCTGVELTFYGDVDELCNPKEVENAIYISNHQSTMDWILGCSFALRRGALNRCRYVVKDGLKYFPLYGFYLTQHGVLYIKRAGKFQARKAQLQLQNMVKHKTPTQHYFVFHRVFNKCSKSFNKSDSPRNNTHVASHLLFEERRVVANRRQMWMVVFPEGTRYNSELKDVIARSQKFSLEQGTQELHQVLYPRTKATYVCLQELHDYVTSFYDVTIAYNNTRDAATGQRTTSPGMPDFLSGHTSKVHMHIRKIQIKEIPLEEEEFKKWLLEQFHLKDKLLQHFYSFEDQDKAAFPGPGYQIPLSFKSTVPSFLLWGGSFAACMAFQETRNIYWKVGLASLVTGLIWVSVQS